MIVKLLNANCLHIMNNLSSLQSTWPYLLTQRKYIDRTTLIKLNREDITKIYLTFVDIILL